ncbi:MAG: hypothetical protein RL498_586, partial [Pseudomonadota bacterium]
MRKSRNSTSVKEFKLNKENPFISDAVQQINQN